MIIRIIIILLAAFSAIGQNVTNLYVGQSLYVGQALTTVPSTSGIDSSGLIIQWEMDAGSGNTVTNKAGAGFFVGNNILPAPENHFANGKNNWIWAGDSGNQTWTDGYATDPNGLTNNASRWTSVAGSGRLALSQNLTTLQGPIIYTAYLKSNASTNQLAQFAFYNGSTWLYSPDFTVTTNWQRFTNSFTVTAGNNRQLSALASGSDHSANDILIWGAQLEYTNATAYSGIDTNWNLNLGLFRTTTNNWMPRWTTNGVYYPSGTSLQSGAFGSVTLSNATFYSVFKQYGTLAGATFAPVLNGIFADANFSIWLCKGGLRSWFQWSVVNNDIDTVSSSGPYADANLSDGYWHTMTSVYDGTNATMYVDSALMGIRTNAGKTISLKDLTLGGCISAGTYFAGEIAYVLVYNVSHDANKVSSVSQSIASKLLSRGLVVKPLPYYVAVEGDSRTFYDYSYIRQSMTNSFGTNVHAGIFARPSSTFTIMTNRVAGIDSAYDSSRSKNILSVLIGVNDWSGIQPTQYVANIKGYCLARRSVGYKILVCTELPAAGDNHPGWLTNRATINTLLRGDNSFYDTLCDLGADPTMGVDSACSNATYYGDGVHPTTLGATILSTNLVNSLKTLIP